MTIQADQIRNRRRTFAAPGGSLDRIVRILAVALPAMVGVIAAMMLIAPLSQRSEISFMLDRNKVAVANDRLRVESAMYRGQDNTGRPFSVMAGNAVQQSASVPVVELNKLTARMLLADGPAVLDSPKGRYFIDTEHLTVPGTVRFTAADGYQMAASNVTIDLRLRTLVGNGSVSGVIPAGTFSANSIRADLEARTVTLDGNARMQMVPGRLKMPSSMP